jgi:hypothetical protein
MYAQRLPNELWDAAEIGIQRSWGLFRANRERVRVELLRRNNMLNTCEL